MALQEDDDTTGDVISVDGKPTETKEPVDRGDEFQPELDLDNQKDPVKEAPADTRAPGKEEVKDTPKEEVKPQHIPKSRFDEVNNRKNELAAELAEAQRVIEALKAPKPATDTGPVFDEDAKEQEYIDAMMAGDGDLAKSIRREINAHLRDQVTEQVTAQVEQSNHQREASISLKQVAAQTLQDYPYLDTPEGEEALDLILASRDAKIAKGIAPAEALSTAVATIAPKFKPEGDIPPVGIDPAVPATDTRTAAALARGATDSTLQPPSVQAGTGNRATAGRVNVSEMTEEQFENLSPAEKKRMRGDM